MTERVTRLLRAIAIYYRRWPLLVALLAITLNTVALLDKSYNWAFMIAGNSLLLFLIGHSASKAASAIDVVQQVTNELQLMSQKNDQHFSKLQQKGQKALKLARENSRLSRKSQEQASCAISISNEAKEVSAQAKEISAQTKEVSAQSLDQSLAALKLASAVEKKVSQAVAIAQKAIKQSDFSFQSLKCLDARYSLYLSTYPLLSNHDNTDQVSLFNNHSLDFHQTAQFILPHCKIGELDINLSDQIKKTSELILVHQMGKVGSSGICASILNTLPDSLVLHTHSLNKAKFYKSFYKRLVDSPYSEKIAIERHYLTTLLLVQELDHNFESKRWNIVTLVRDPIARNISAFFEIIDLKIFFPNYLETGCIVEDEVESAISWFLEKYPHDLPLTWLDDQIRDVFGIDVFEGEFDKSKGYAIYSKENVNVLLIRLESLNDSYKTAFREFLGIENFELQSANMASEKRYKDVYQSFKQRLSLPESYIQRMYNSKYAKHFYSDEELAAFTAKWNTAH